MSRFVTVIALVGMLGLVSSPALAKGPSSATLSGPGIDEPTVFLDPQSINTMAPVDLVGQTGLWTGPLTAVVEVPADLGPAYTVTWVNSGPHHVSVELRTIHQHIYLEAPGGPLIHTPEQIGLAGWGDGTTGWFQGSDSLRQSIDNIIARVSTPGDTSSPIWPVVTGALALGAVFIWRSRVLR